MKKAIESINYFFDISIMMLALFGIILFILTYVLETSFVLSQKSLNSIILLMLSATLIQSSNLVKTTTGITKGSEKMTLDSRLSDLISSLAQAGNAISAIESEINSRQELVEKLEKQKIIAEQAINLSKEQVDAVSALLSEQVAKQSRSDNMKDWVKQIFFFVLGVVATIFLT